MQYVLLLDITASLLIVLENRQRLDKALYLQSLLAYDHAERQTDREQEEHAHEQNEVGRRSESKQIGECVNPVREDRGEHRDKRKDEPQQGIPQQQAPRFDLPNNADEEYEADGNYKQLQGKHYAPFLLDRPTMEMAKDTFSM